jgi:hypothetical protein
MTQCTFRNLHIATLVRFISPIVAKIAANTLSALPISLYATHTHTRAHIPVDAPCAVGHA